MKNENAYPAVTKVMAWLRSNWRWAALNLFGASTIVVVLTQGSTDWNSTRFEPGLEGGKWAMRFLLICLTMTPLNTYFGWSSQLKLRKPAGLWAFAFALIHLSFYISQAKLDWITWQMQPYLVLGLLGMLVLTALAITSNHWAMRRLQKNWKRLHRMVYLAGMAGAFHAILATTASKKLIIRDPQSIYELQFYLGVTFVLLAVRLPIVRRISIRAFAPRRIPHQVDLPITPIAVPSSQPKLLPEIYAIEKNIAIVELFRGPDREDARSKHEELPARTNLPLAS